MELGEHDPLRSKPIQIRRRDLASEASQVGPAHVICDDEQDIGALVGNGLLDEDDRELLNEIYEYNPLLFDYAVKRSIRHPETGTRFPASVFTGSDLGPVVRAPWPGAS